MINFPSTEFISSSIPPRLSVPKVLFKVVFVFAKSTTVPSLASKLSAIFTLFALIPKASSKPTSPTLPALAFAPTQLFEFFVNDVSVKLTSSSSNPAPLIPTKAFRCPPSINKRFASSTSEVVVFFPT